MDFNSPVIVLGLVLASIIGTPGPNNALLFVSGLKVGFKKSISSLIAINAGAISMILVSLWATDLVGSLLTSAYDYLKIFSALLLLYLSYGLWANANKQPQSFAQLEDASSSISSHSIMTPLQLYFFQFVNPKIWLASVSIVSSFKQELAVITIVLSASLIGFLLNSLWVMCGMSLRKMNLNISNSTISKIGACILFLCVPYFLFS